MVSLFELIFSVVKLGSDCVMIWFRFYSNSFSVFILHFWYQCKKERFIALIVVMVFMLLFLFTCNITALLYKMLSPLNLQVTVSFSKMLPEVWVKREHYDVV